MWDQHFIVKGHPPSISEFTDEAIMDWLSGSLPFDEKFLVRSPNLIITADEAEGIYILVKRP